jgi:shikimate dehydrogenase
MKKQFGLLGKTLKHSFSKPIHEYFTKLPYHLIEVDDVKQFLTKKAFGGVNVTIPYKKAVIPYLDELSEEAKAIGTVNSITCHNNHLTGYNTDAFGFEFLLNYHNVDLKDKVILIVGNGSTSRTIQYVSNKKHAKQIVVLARHPKENEYLIEQYKSIKNVDLVINTTPVGMYPNTSKTLPIDLSVWEGLLYVIDVIYNPLKTPLLRQSSNLNVPAINGLIMLVAQAAKSIEYFHKKAITEKQIISYYKRLLFEKTNIVLVGMPMSGKSLYGKLLSEKLNKIYIDTDAEIVNSQKMSIKDIFSTHGEPFFRTIESRIVSDCSKETNQIISCGGGVVLNEKNVFTLKQNGIIIFIDTPLSILAKMDKTDRPLLKQDKSLELLYEARYNTYINMVDIVFPKSSLDIDENLEKLVVVLNEYIGIKWT